MSVCPVSLKQRRQMEARHREYPPRQNTDTPCHQSQYFDMPVNISGVKYNGGRFYIVVLVYTTKGKTWCG